MLSVWDESAIAAFCNAKAVDGGAGFEGQLVVELGGATIGWYGDFLRELLDWLAWGLGEFRRVDG